ncbi:MAG TPA: 6-phosphogluconolactonase [Gemmatimonadales bacterium]|nr:6-phosphogluconolactonase [Gemmatimonadales bacterium]
MREPPAAGRGALHVFADPAALALAGAARIAAAAAEAIAARGRFRLVLAGGDTPRQTYEVLTGPEFVARVDWPRVEFFWGDERCVPPDDPRSNYRMARESLLDRVPIVPENVHRIRGEEDPARAALEYEERLGGLLPDLVLLGLGVDGHTASLFPGLAAVRERDRRVVAEYVGTVEAWRVTMTPPLLNSARAVAFLVSGAGKAGPLRQVLQGGLPPDLLPARAIHPASGRLDWLLDAAAASGLPHVSTHSVEG